MLHDELLKKPNIHKINIRAYGPDGSSHGGKPFDSPILGKLLRFFFLPKNQP